MSECVTKVVRIYVKTSTQGTPSLTLPLTPSLPHSLPHLLHSLPPSPHSLPHSLPHSPLVAVQALVVEEERRLGRVGQVVDLVHRVRHGEDLGEESLHLLRVSE
jgi:hypothetical protein